MKITYIFVHEPRKRPSNSTLLNLENEWSGVIEKPDIIDKFDED